MMSNTFRTFATLPGFVMAGFLTHASGATTLRTETSASISWKGETSLSTLSSSSEDLPAPEFSAEAVVKSALKGMSLAALAKTAFPNSRPMEDWEKQATHRFVLSHFR
jgi:hypothetical protein